MLHLIIHQLFAITNIFSLRFICFYVHWWIYVFILLALGNWNIQWDSEFTQNQNVLGPKPVKRLSRVVKTRLATGLPMKPSVVNDKHGMSDAASSSVAQNFPWGSQITYKRN